MGGYQVFGVIRENDTVWFGPQSPQRRAKSLSLSIHSSMPGCLDPLVHLFRSNVIVGIKALPVDNLVQILLPAFNGGFERRAKTHHINDSEVLGHGQERAHFRLNGLLPDGSDPPHGVTQRGRSKMSGKRGSRDRLQQDSLGILLVEFVFLRSIEQNRERANETIIAANDDQARGGSDSFIVWSWETHFEARAMLLFVEKASGQRFPRCRIVH